MSELTHVELVWVKKRIENRIRFGRIAEQHIIDRQRRVVSFTAGSIFAFVRWTANDYGTVVSRIDILRAVAPGERYATVPYVRPGGESLLRISGWPKVEKVLQAIDAIEALGIDPADAAPDHWQHIHNRTVAHTAFPSGVKEPDGAAAGERAGGDGCPRVGWVGRVFAAGEFFLMNGDEPASLDGRYFGPIPLRAIVGRAEPLWTFEE